MHLLDVNVLIALADGSHSFHQSATQWLAERVDEGWATCPLTENGLLRILSTPAYPSSPGGPAEVRRILDRLRAAKGFQFWPDEVSFADTLLFPTLTDVSPRQLTDIYLLGLAVRRGARFATFDNHVPPGAVAGGDAATTIIPVPRKEKP